MSKIKKVLIANRGEIAVRVSRSLKRLGIQSVSIYTEPEKALPHAVACDESLNLGEGPLSETYLNQKKLIQLAKQCKADAIHPGYGFLSENAEFAQAVSNAGLIFIGPKPKVIKLMGDKTASKVAMEKSGVPLIPGYHGADQEAQKLKKHAQKMGYPLLIKAAAGGGGKGMRLVEQESDFEEALSAAKREAKSTFSNDQVLLEKYILNPRHIEVQVFSDSKGNHVHLFERECSIQRRHQKVIEETPSTALDDKLRDKITKTAVKVAKSVDYLGAGTVEFMLDKTGAFYFLEMNTRLQVEHPITEMITNVDLVEWQILVAQGAALPLKQKDIVSHGHAIEVRLYAENPDVGFLPTSGKIRYIGRPTLDHTRLECGYAQGNTVGVDFDPMLAKLVAWGENRDEAISSMLHSLEEVLFSGLITNRDYVKRILKHKSFKQGQTFTNFIQTHAKTLEKTNLDQDQLAQVIAGYMLGKSKLSSSDAQKDRTDTWNSLKGFRNV